MEVGRPALGGWQSPHSRPESTDVTLPRGTNGLAAASFSRALWYFRLWHRHEESCIRFPSELCACPALSPSLPAPTVLFRALQVLKLILRAVSASEFVSLREV